MTSLVDRPVCKSDDREAFLRAAKAERELTEIVGGPKAYQEHKENSFQVVPENKNAFDMVMKFQPSIHNLYLYGPCGAGKTMLARMAAIAIYGEGYKVEILRPRELVRKVWRNDFRYEEQELEHYSKLDVLIVDELGAGKNNEGLTAVLLEILSRRIDSGKAGMIITSNLSLSDLALKLDDNRIPSRIREVFKDIYMTGPGGKDWRKIKNPRGGAK